jgi:hypothetical protein
MRVLADLDSPAIDRSTRRRVAAVTVLPPPAGTAAGEASAPRSCATWERFATGAV